MNQNDFRAEFEINEADMRLQWQFTAFLSKVVHHARCDYLRKERRNQARMVSQDTDNKSMAENTADPKAQERLERILERDLINRQIVRLTLRERQALLLVCVEEFTLKQAAQKMGVSVGRVEQLKNAALKKLKKALQEEDV